MPLDVHKNCLRICIVRFIEHQQQARWKATWNVFFWQRSWRRGQAEDERADLSYRCHRNPRPILSAGKHHSIQNYLRCKGLSWPCGFNITRENYPGESFHLRWMLHRRLNFFFLSFHWKGLSLRAKARLCDLESCTFRKAEGTTKSSSEMDVLSPKISAFVPEGSLEWTHKACSSSSIKTHLGQDICGHPFICAFPRKRRRRYLGAHNWKPQGWSKYCTILDPLDIQEVPRTFSCVCYPSPSSRCCQDRCWRSTERASHVQNVQHHPELFS